MTVTYDGLLCYKQPDMIFYKSGKFIVPMIDKFSGRIILHGVIYI